MLSRKSRRAAAIGSNWLRHRVGREFSLHESVVILAPPRSGSTWVTEVIGSWPGFGVVNEPLHPQFAAPRALRLESRTYLSPTSTADDLEDYLRAAMTGDVVRPFAVGFSNPMEPWKVDRWISKVVHGAGLTGWLGEHLPEPQYVGLLRHPCAVVASQRHKKMVSPDAFHGARLQFAKLWPELAPALASVTTEVSRYAACWCMDTLALTNGKKPPRFRLVCYEDLVSDGDAAFANLADWIGVSRSAVDASGLSLPSASTDDPHVGGTAQLGKWQERLTRAEVDEIFSLLDAFGLSVYRKGSLEPDHRAARTPK
jgi:hypothetical protein